MRRPSVSRMREIRTSGLKGDLRKRSPSATAPEVYQWTSNPRRRWCQFRLRTLLIATALIAAVLGWIVKERHQVGGEGRIGTELQSCGAHIEFAGLYDQIGYGRANPPTSWWRACGAAGFGRPHHCSRQLPVAWDHCGRLRPTEPATSVRSVVLLQSPVCDLTPLANQTELRHLELTDTQVRDLATLAGLVHLRTLTLCRTPISDLSPLAGLNELHTLTLDASLSPICAADRAFAARLAPYLEYVSQISDISPLAGLARLRKLYLIHTSVSDLGPLTDSIIFKASTLL